MSAGTSASLCLMICLLICSCEAQTIKPENITAERGENATLPCKVPINNKTIIAVKWSRPDQDPEYVLLYRDGFLDPDNQQPGYKNRVDLQNKEMKNGDVSLILKKVKMEDTGTYVCHVFQRGKNRWKRSSLKTKTTYITTLVVLEPGDQDRITGNGGDMNGGGKVGISRGHLGVVAVILLLAVLASVCFLMYKRSMRQNPNLPVPPDEATVEQML